MQKSNLTKALLQVQRDMKEPKKSGLNKAYERNPIRFSKLEDLIEVSRELLLNNGLVINHRWESDGTLNYFVTELRHAESGESDISRAAVFLTDPSDMHKTGSAETYFKRRMYASICGIDPSDPDDDGNLASSPTSIPKFQENYNIPSESSRFSAPQGAKSPFISPKQWGFLKAKIRESGRPEKEQSLCLKFGVRSLNELPWENMKEALSLVGFSDNAKPMLDPQYKENAFIDESVTPF